MSLLLDFLIFATLDTSSTPEYGQRTFGQHLLSNPSLEARQHGSVNFGGIENMALLSQA